MRLLFLSFYFRPDLCAGSFRATPLASVLAESYGCEVDVLTTLPNRYRSFLEDAAEFEEANGVRIRRIALPPHSSDILGQSKAFLRFAAAVRRIACDISYDAVFATSSRLMTAALGAHLAQRRNVPLYLDIRDIFADTIGDVLPGMKGRIANRLFSLLERRTVQQASHINLVSEGFGDYFRERYPGVSFSFYPNGIDDEFISTANLSVPNRKASDPIEILYAGNLGEGQCLHRIVPSLAKVLQGRASFTIIGDGGRRNQLESALREIGVENVRIEPPVARHDLVRRYLAADVLFLHLGDHPAFEKVLPSKIFEYAAMGKPILAGTAGFSGRFLKREVENSAVFSPCDVSEALEALDQLRLEKTDRSAFVAKYRRGAISERLSRSIIDTLRNV